MKSSIIRTPWYILVCVYGVLPRNQIFSQTVLCSCCTSTAGKKQKEKYGVVTSDKGDDGGSGRLAEGTEQYSKKSLPQKKAQDNNHFFYLNGYDTVPHACIGGQRIQNTRPKY